MKNSKWGSSAGPGKDPMRKRSPRVFGKKRATADPKTYQKIMAKASNKGKFVA